MQVWNLGSSSPNFTLEGHEKGINCVDYYHGGDKPYLISGADDRFVKIWDYQVLYQSMTVYTTKSTADRYYIMSLSVTCHDRLSVSPIWAHNVKTLTKA